jgi:hypothetical protein
MSFNKFVKTTLPIQNNLTKKISPIKQFDISKNLKPGDRIYYIHNGAKIYGVFYRYQDDWIYGIQVWAEWIYPTFQSVGWMPLEDIQLAASDGAE